MTPNAETLLAECAALAAGVQVIEPATWLDYGDSPFGHGLKRLTLLNNRRAMTVDLCPLGVETLRQLVGRVRVGPSRN